MLSSSAIWGVTTEAYNKPVIDAFATPTPTAIKGTPSPKPSAKPAVSPSPTLPQRAGSTLADLQSKIRQRMNSPEVARGRIGIKIVSLNSGKVIFENDADKYFMPASNMKNFTVAAAMERLTPDYRFVTSVYAQSRPDANGTVNGDLRIFGRGDISISTAFYGTSVSDPDTYFKGIDRLVDAIAAAGIKRITGGLIGDESYFTGNAIPATWELDDLQWYYGAEISALPLNDNAVDIRITPDTNGGPCIITISPSTALYQINNTCVTGGQKNISIDKSVSRNIINVSGTMPRGASYTGSIAISHPADLFVELLKRRLATRGIEVVGSSRIQPLNISSPAGQIEIAKLESPPFALIAAKTMKPSQNMYTETILWTLGEEKRRRTPGASGDSAALGLASVREFLTSIGIPKDGILQYDGCGLSRHDLITPSAVVSLYTYMAKKSQYTQAWRDSLTIGGVDGTLASRFKGTSAEGNVRGKTGTIDQVSALSGYVTTASGEPLVLSIVVNGVAVQKMRTSLIDDIVVSLANYNGSLDQ